MPVHDDVSPDLQLAQGRLVVKDEHSSAHFGEDSMDDKHRSDELARLVDQWYSQARRVDGRSALMGGALGLLLSSRHGRGVLGKVLKYGLVAGAGALAWQARSERERSASHSEDVARPLPGDETPTAASRQEESFTTRHDDPEPPLVP